MFRKLPLYINKFITGKGLLVLSVIMMALLSMWFDGSGVTHYVRLSWIALCAVMLTLLDKHFSIIREVTMLETSAWLLLMALVPLNVSTPHAVEGLVLLAVLLMGTATVFACIDMRFNQRAVCLMMLVVSSVSYFVAQVGYLVVILIAGLILLKQMRWRTFIAAMLGVIAPIWTNLLAFQRAPILPEWLTVLPLKVPQISALSEVAFNTLLVECAALMLLMFFNFFRVMHYKTHIRRFNWFLMMASFVFMALAVAQFSRGEDAEIYLPTIHAMLGVQVAHAFTCAKWQHRYVCFLAFLIILSTYWILFIKG